MAKLFELTEQMAEIEYLLEENGGELTPELEQVLVETKESLQKKVDDYSAVIRKISSQSKAIADEIKRLQGMKKTCDNSVTRIKDHLIACMSNFGLSKIEGDMSKFYLRDTKVLNMDEGAVLNPWVDCISKLQSQLPTYLHLEVKINKKEVERDESGNLPIGFEDGVSTSVILK